MNNHTGPAIPRQPLNWGEMTQLVDDLLKEKPTDRDKAYFLAGLKIGTLSGYQIPEAEEALEMCKVIFMFQQTYDPDGETWNLDVAVKEKTFSGPETITNKNTLDKLMKKRFTPEQLKNIKEAAEKKISAIQNESTSNH